MKTENLAIVMTDIVGFTQTTQNQSRQDNARLLATHARILLPIVKRFKGEHVKSIGDALLLVFRSPTDAMLCAMAMQDALFEYNRHASESEQIHIRIAASLGEVRVTRHDVFGEAVNLTSRLEGVTPSDEIYLTEAVYMAMNKAEVPAQEVGVRELKGISESIRVYHIPRFSTPRLVPQDPMAAQDMTDLVYPYGGAHLTAAVAEEQRLPTAKVAMLAVFIVVPLAVFAMFYLRPPAPSVPTSPAAVVADTAVALMQVEPQVNTATPAPPPAASPPKPPNTLASAKKEPSSPVNPVETKPRKEPVAVAAPPPGEPVYAKLSDAKKALKDGKISKGEFKTISDRLSKQRTKEIEKAKLDYKNDKITKKEYRDRVEEIEKRYQ